MCNYVPTTSKVPYIAINILLRPYRKLQRSLKEPVMGDRKKPNAGDNANTNDITFWLIPTSRRIGPLNAVIAAYANSIPITTAVSRINSHRDFFLEKKKKKLQIIFISYPWNIALKFKHKFCYFIEYLWISSKLFNVMFKIIHIFFRTYSNFFVKLYQPVFQEIPSLSVCSPLFCCVHKMGSTKLAI